MDNLMGITFGNWTRLLRENRYDVSGRNRERMAKITIVSLLNSRGAALERSKYGQQIAAARVKAPVFVLGHWRSGTTLLHELLSLDEQFSYANLFQVSNPDCCLVREERVRRYLEESQKAPQTRPMDQVETTALSPGEDEFGVAVMTQRSPLIAWSFPKSEPFYDRFLTFENVEPAEVERWRQGQETFLRKLMVRYPGKRLLLKSPPHTARIKLLLQMYPDAQFVLVRRNPLVVYQSTLRLFETAIIQSYMQDVSPDFHVPGVVRRYKAMYDAYLEQRSLIPAGNLHEVRFEDLERDLIGQVECIYQALGWSGFATILPKLQEYVNRKAGYQKNRHAELDAGVRERLYTAWRRTFEEWGYQA